MIAQQSDNSNMTIQKDSSNMSNAQEYKKHDEILYAMATNIHILLHVPNAVYERSHHIKEEI
jgi:hypothetical protein